jgi:hypothetical protein
MLANKKLGGNGGVKRLRGGSARARQILSFLLFRERARRSQFLGEKPISNDGNLPLFHAIDASRLCQKSAAKRSGDR